MTYSILGNVVFIFNNEYHVKPRENSWHEVNVLQVIVKVCVRERGEKNRQRLTASPLVSSHRPNTELAAASTEHRELSVVVIPA